MSQGPVDSTDTAAAAIVCAALLHEASGVLGRQVSSTETLVGEDLSRIIEPWRSLLRGRLHTLFHRWEVEDHPSAAALARYALDQVGLLASHLARTAEPAQAPSTPLAAPVGFILSAPRSGSTLLRVMLAGHPGLFCPPELHLLGFADMRGRRATESSTDRNNGLSHALSRLLGLGLAQADLLAVGWEHDAMPIWRVYERLTAAAAPRMLIDKSPGNARNADRVEAIARWFDSPRVIYLTRHPVAVIDSLVRNRFGHLMGAGSADPYELAERVWLQYNGVIEAGLRLFPTDHVRTVTFEELVTRPEATLRALCPTLGVPFTDELLHPYEGDRMRVGAGDPNFGSLNRIEPELATVGLRIRLPHRLNPLTVALAQRLGYAA